MKVSCNRVGGLLITSARQVCFGATTVPKYEGGIFKANRWFALSPATHGNFGLIVVCFKIGIYFVKRSAS